MMIMMIIIMMMMLMMMMMMTMIHLISWLVYSEQLFATFSDCLCLLAPSGHLARIHLAVWSSNGTMPESWLPV